MGSRKNVVNIENNFGLAGHILGQRTRRPRRAAGGHRGAGAGSGCALSMALGDTGGDDDALPSLEELSGADASPRNGAGACCYDFDREDRRRGVRGGRHDEVPVLRRYIDNPCRTAAKFVILGALSPGQKWRLYFRDFFSGFSPLSK